MRKPIYFFIIFIISILCSGFSHIFGMEQVSVNTYQEQQIVENRLSLLYNSIKYLLRDILCKCNSGLYVLDCVFSDRSLCRYTVLSANINNALFVQNLHLKSENIQIKPCYGVKDKDVDIAKEILIKEFRFLDKIIHETDDNAYILPAKLKQALQGFAEEIYNILGKVREYQIEKTNLEVRIDEIFCVLSDNLSGEVKILRNKWEKISTINITSEIKGAISAKMTENIKKIESFKKRDYADAGLHSEELLNHLQNRFQDKNSPTKNIKTQKHGPNKKWPLYAGILGGILIATGVSFGIYYGVKKGKSGEEEDQTILLADE